MGEWLSFHAFALPVNFNGLRFRPTGSPAPHGLAVRNHVRRVTDQLQVTLARSSSALYASVVDAALASDSSELSLLALRLHFPGPPLHIALDSIALPGHRAAVSSFLCADRFFGKSAHNYFAKRLLPRTGLHAALVDDAGIVGSSVCLACWHFRRLAVLEDEFHCVCVCPEHDKARQELV